MEVRDQLHVPAALLSVALALCNSTSMEQIPSWESNRFAASQEILRISRNPNVHYLIHKIPPTLPIQNNSSLYRMDRKFVEPQNQIKA